MITTRFKLDTTMLQSKTASHLMAFMIMQRDLLLKFIEAAKVSDKNVNIAPKLDIDLVARDFEYLIKAHAHALHQKTGVKIYNKNDDDEMYHMNNREA